MSANSTCSPPANQQQQQQQQQQVRHVMRMFELPDEALKSIKEHMRREFELGLSDEESATIKMLITYVRELARGNETGSYLALDLGGTHFRVLLVDLADGKAKVTSAVHDIPPELLVTQEGSLLFDYVALKLLEFVQQHKLKRRRVSLGFTFSFPCKQYGLTQSTLVKWCKGFNVGGVVGTDVVRQLKDALKRQLAGLVEAYIDVVAVINDTTGTLVACANFNPQCRIGLIVGTGYNACYMERLDRCEKWPANYTSPKQVIVNCEWGALGDNPKKRELDPYRNELDAQVDRDSVNAGSQTYEKMVGGMYIGELLRLALVRLYKAKAIFVDQPDVVGPSDTQSIASASSSAQTVGASSSPSTRGTSPSASTSPESSPKTRSVGGSISSSNAATSPDSSSPRATGNLAPNQQQSHNLYTKNVLDGRHLSMLAKDELSGSHQEAINVMKALNVSNYSEDDLKIVIQLASIIMTRAAHLVASGISTILERLKRSSTVIGYDGSVIKHHPWFLAKVIKKCSQLTPPEYKFEFMLSSDGSGIGAAVVAAALHKERRPLYVVKPGKLYEMHFTRNPQSSTS